jgi:hypothetical protein
MVKIFMLFPSSFFSLSLFFLSPSSPLALIFNLCFKDQDEGHDIRDATKTKTKTKAKAKTKPKPKTNKIAVQEDVGDADEEGTQT